MEQYKRMLNELNPKAKEMAEEWLNDTKDMLKEMFIFKIVTWKNDMIFDVLEDLSSNAYRKDGNLRSFIASNIVWCVTEECTACQIERVR